MSLVGAWLPTLSGRLVPIITERIPLDACQTVGESHALQIAGLHQFGTQTVSWEVRSCQLLALEMPESLTSRGTSTTRCPQSNFARIQRNQWEKRRGTRSSAHSRRCSFRTVGPHEGRDGGSSRGCSGSQDNVLKQRSICPSYPSSSGMGGTLRVRESRPSSPGFHSWAVPKRVTHRSLRSVMERTPRTTSLMLHHGLRMCAGVASPPISMQTHAAASPKIAARNCTLAVLIL